MRAASAARKTKGKAKAKAKGAMKKPATHKRPAAAILKRPASKLTPVPGWSTARRMKAYPEGCSKCRDKPGCTRSCFASRERFKLYYL